MTKTKVVQNVNRMSEIFFSLCQYVSMSICQNATFQLGYQNVIRTPDSHYVIMSLCQYVSMSVCQYVNMSIGLYISAVCQYVRMQLFSLGIKMKVVIRMSDSQKILVRKSLRTAKEPALVLPKNKHIWPRIKST